MRQRRALIQAWGLAPGVSAADEQALKARINPIGFAVIPAKSLSE
jgi:hypothetical protein